jgi:UDP-glucose 4-epimerase
MNGEKVLVTGGAGFIGSHLVDALIELGAKVTVIDARKPKKTYKNESAKYKLMRIETEEAHIFVKKMKPAFIFHLAAHIHDRESIHEPVMNAENNIIGTLNLLEAIRAQKNVRFIFASTGGVIYGNQDDVPVTEQAEPRPLTPYAISKLTAERYLDFYRSTAGISYAALRFANVFGPRQDSSAESGAIAIFTAALLKGDQAFINDDGETTRDYVYVKDVVRAFLLAAEADYSGVLNIGTGIERSTKEIYAAVQEVIGTETGADTREEIKDVVRRSALDASLAEEEINWEPQTAFEDGLRETVDWYNDHL